MSFERSNNERFANKTKAKPELSRLFNFKCKVHMITLKYDQTVNVNRM